jgi:hypothetical protein
MRKEYKYLQDPWYEDANGQRERRNFLALVDNFVNQKQYVKITLLNWSEEPLKEIEGELSSGTLSKDGSSSVRRSCQLTASISRGEYDVEDSEMDFAINKKIFIEIGIKNYTDQYPEYPILWFPQGVFFISDFAITSSSSSTVNISLTLKDKMCGLNGVVGGTFQSVTILDEVDTQTASGQFVSEKVLVYNIIQEVVHHFGGEDLNNIVIEDVPLRIKRVMKWAGDNPMWMIPAENTSAQAGNLWYSIELEEPAIKPSGTLQIMNGTDAGYIFDDFYYTGELTANAGETVTSVLDKLVQYLGNYEYFYDEFGVFHFREIKNYLNTTQAEVLVNDMDKNDYLVDTTTGKDVYTFSDDSNLVSISVTPSYSNIKNDYVIHGTRKMTDSDISYDVFYHLCIDKKPKPGNTYYDLLLFKEQSTGLIKAIFPLSVPSEADLPQPGNFNLIYRTTDTNSFFYWEDDVYKEVDVIKYYPGENQEGSLGYTTKDWRTELYLQGLLAKNNGTDAGLYYSDLEYDYTAAQYDDSWIGQIHRQVKRNRIDTDYYFEELEAFWPQIYDLENQQFYAEQQDQTLLTSALTDGNYFLDFIDPSTSDLGEFSISNIGRRMDVVVNEDVNCLFQPSIPDIVFLNIDDDDFLEKRQECQLKGQPFTQVRGDVFSGFYTGGYKNGAFDQIKYELYLHTNYQKTLSLTSLPVFYLEPNSRVTINDKSTNTYGSFVIKTLSIPLGPGNMMATTASETFERF